MGSEMCIRDRADALQDRRGRSADREDAGAAHADQQRGVDEAAAPVSYTHLTLPTSDLV